ncbi:MAG: hypothetical protein EOO90_16910 [Pedobacter sp.]|nr:MAG: hypothetical protein EOO90_16910 [Pedobacter sp.]
MSTIEEQIWNYIDGTCTSEEKIKIESKLAYDQHYREVYQELLLVNEELQKIELDEPSMSFTRNVMDKVNLELKPVALKTKVDTRIVQGIAAFFVLALLSVSVYTISTSDLSFKMDFPKINLWTDISKYIDSTAIKVFLFIDLAIALVFFDSMLRKRDFSAQKKGD